MTKEHTSQKISLGGFAIVNTKKDKDHILDLCLFAILFVDFLI